jgi:hypothetical protein
MKFGMLNKGTQGKINKLHFPPSSFKYTRRCTDSFEANAKLGADSCPYMGIYGPTILSNHIEFPSAIVSDMHFIDLGQFKQYLASDNKFEEYYLGLDIIF